MRFVKTYKFGDVKGYELGWSPFGHPMMTVYLYLVDDLMIDTGMAHMRREVLEITRDAGIQKALLTHHHEDHSGNAASLKDALKVTVYGHPYQINSLKKILRFDFDAVLCSHHPKPANGKERIAEKLQFLEDICGGIRITWEKGYREMEIFRELGLKEQHFIKWFCFGNVSMRNAVRSPVRSFEATPQSRKK